MIQKIISENLHIQASNIQKLAGYDSENYLVSTAEAKYLIKIYRDARLLEQIKEEQRIIDHLDHILSVKLPLQLKPIVILPDGSFIRTCRFIEGSFLHQVDINQALLRHYGQSIGKMHKVLMPLNSAEIKAKRSTWDLQFAMDNVDKLKYILKPKDQKLVHYFLDQYNHRVLPKIKQLPKSIIHGDLNEHNILVNQTSLVGLIDFGDCSYGPLINDIAIALCYLLMLDDSIDLDLLSPFISAYHAIRPIMIEEIDLIFWLIAARLCVSVLHSAEAKALSTDTDYILISEKAAWNLLHKWISINPISYEQSLRKALGFKSIETTIESITEKRTTQIGHGLSLSYTVPIHMQSAAFQYMFDASGNTYLDAYNNIPIIGHSHPKIAEVISEKSRKLNTNTRYHYDELTQYSEHLLSYFPEKLNRLYLVNSGSAASDLAARLVRNYTKRKSILVTNHGYHGNSTIGINLSPYKFNSKGGKGEADSTITLPLPKAYNGDFATREQYVQSAINTIEHNIGLNNKPAAYFTECISGCGGQVPLMKGYLKDLQKYLSEKEILLVTDEVQTGFGRLGKYFWGYEMMEVIPDIVIIGKPMGNGHPIGGVITTEEISTAFDNGMEFFSSFGGNPISCAIGKTVLEVIENEGLQDQAREVGHYFKSELQALQIKHAAIGDIRGEGLFLGIELADYDNKSSTEIAKYIKEKMKQNYILTSTDGPLNNVIKTKPPLCFSVSNVQRFVQQLDDILSA